MRQDLLTICVMTLALALSSAANAAGLALTCAKADVMNAKWGVPITFRFDDGEKEGTLNVSGPFGDFALPARRVEMPIDASETGEAIDAVAKARVKLPALADLEACITKSAGPGKVENDELLNARDACLRKLRPAADGVDAVAQIRLGFMGADDSGEDAFVVFKLRYDTAGQSPDTQTSVEAFPAQCKLQK